MNATKIMPDRNNKNLPSVSWFIIDFTVKLRCDQNYKKSSWQSGPDWYDILLVADKNKFYENGPYHMGPMIWPIGPIMNW